MNLELRNAAKENYKKDLERIVCDILQPYVVKFTNQDEIQFFSKWVVANRFLEAEVRAYMHKLEKDPSKSWVNFVVTSDTRNSVNHYLIKKMATYKPGEVYKRAQ